MLRVASVLRSTEVHPGLFSDLFASVSFSFLFSSAELHTRSFRLGVGAGGGWCILALAKCSEQNTRSHQHDMFREGAGSVKV